MPGPETVRFLKGTSLFAQFSERELEAVLRTAKERVFEASNLIVREGDPAGWDSISCGWPSGSTQG